MLEEKSLNPAPHAAMSYGNMPLAIAENGSSSTEQQPSKQSKFEEHGKKFGKKMGNAGMSTVLPIYLYTC